MNRFAGLRLLGPYLGPHRGRVALALLSLLVAAGTKSSGAKPVEATPAKGAAKKK